MTPSIFVGVMSGTSLDNIDIVACSFDPTFAILGTYTHPFPASIRQKLLALTQPGDNEIARIAEVEPDLSSLYAEAVRALLSKTNLAPSDITAIGNHGQTIRHYPELNYTLQIGDANVIAEELGITTVADFRRRDIAAGGQGAPLVPAFHQYLFQSPDQPRVIVNIGGMANLTVIPTNANKPVFGYDTGPGNVLMDSWILHCQQLSYDKDGNWARSGSVHPALLSALLAEPYFAEPAPKSTGRELFNQEWLLKILDRFSGISNADIQATLLELTAISISDQIKLLDDWQQHSIYLCGGGAFNSALMNRLQSLMSPCIVKTTDEIGLPVEWVEASAFAWLAYQNINDRTGNLSSVTGASGQRVLGSLHRG